ncbi:MAG: hypothetical protein ACK40K_09785 [Raineya sp.]
MQKNAQIGDWYADSKTLAFRASNGWVEVKDLQIEGKKRMIASEFLKGFRI